MERPGTKYCLSLWKLCDQCYQYFFHPQDIVALIGPEPVWPSIFHLSHRISPGAARSSSPPGPPSTPAILLILLFSWWCLDFLSSRPRWVQPWAAFGAALYFYYSLCSGGMPLSTQGHPYLVCFMASIYLGFRMVDIKEKPLYFLYCPGRLNAGTRSYLAASPGRWQP